MSTVFRVGDRVVARDHDFYWNDYCKVVGKVSARLTKTGGPEYLIEQKFTSGASRWWATAAEVRERPKQRVDAGPRSL